MSCTRSFGECDGKCSTNHSRPCRYFSSGDCRFGRRCRFRHGQAETKWSPLRKLVECQNKLIETKEEYEELLERYEQLKVCTNVLAARGREYRKLSERHSAVIHQEVTSLRGHLSDAQARCAVLFSGVKSVSSAPEEKTRYNTVWTCTCGTVNVKGIHQCKACHAFRRGRGDCSLCLTPGPLGFQCGRKTWVKSLKGTSPFKLLPECPPLCGDCWLGVHSMSYDPDVQSGYGSMGNSLPIEAKCPFCASKGLDIFGIELPSSKPADYWSQ